MYFLLTFAGLQKVVDLLIHLGSDLGLPWEVSPFSRGYLAFLSSTQDYDKSIPVFVHNYDIIRSIRIKFAESAKG